MSEVIELFQVLFACFFDPLKAAARKDGRRFRRVHWGHVQIREHPDEVEIVLLRYDPGTFCPKVVPEGYKEVQGTAEMWVPSTPDVRRKLFA